MRVLVTGGSGRMGRELQAKLRGPVIEAFFPPRAELNITRPTTICAALEHHEPDAVVRTAAYTDAKGAEAQKELCWRMNVGGTWNTARALAGSKAKLVRIFTGCVPGTRHGAGVELLEDISFVSRRWRTLEAKLTPKATR